MWISPEVSCHVRGGALKQVREIAQTLSKPNHTNSEAPEVSSVVSTLVGSLPGWTCPELEQSSRTGASRLGGRPAECLEIQQGLSGEDAAERTDC